MAEVCFGLLAAWPTAPLTCTRRFLKNTFDRSVWPSPKTHLICSQSATFQQWKELKEQEGLESDAEVALIHYFFLIGE